MRGDQTAFMYLHTRAGYSVRGSIAYKRLSTATFAVECSTDPNTVIQQTNFTHHPYTEPPEVVIVAVGAAPTMEIYKGQTK